MDKTNTLKRAHKYAHARAYELFSNKIFNIKFTENGKRYNVPFELVSINEKNIFIRKNQVLYIPYITDTSIYIIYIIYMRIHK